MGSASVVQKVKIEDLECSICLEKIQDCNTLIGGPTSGNDAQKEANGPSGGVVTPLPCNVLHMFHPECIQAWLVKSSACPLCKFNAFTGKLQDDEVDQFDEEPIPEYARQSDPAPPPL